MSKQVCCIMVILTELGGSMPGHHVLNVSGNIGPGSEEVKEVLSSLFSELSRVFMFMWRRNQPTA